MRMLNIRCCFAVVFGLIAQSVYADSFEYSSFLGNRPLITIQTDPPLVASNDRAIDATFCRGGDFSCFKSDWFSFSIPKNRPDDLMEWSSEGSVYRIASFSVVRVFGICREVYKISSTQNDRKLEFMFSPSFGLLGFNLEVDGQVVPYTSEREFGFGAVNPVRKKSLQADRRLSKRNQISSACASAN